MDRTTRPGRRTVDPGTDHPIEEWSDQELLDQYRYIAAELSQDLAVNREADNSPIDVITEEIQRRGLEIPAGSSLTTPGREVTQEGVADAAARRPKR